MIDTDKYERMRQLFLDFIADPMCEEDEAAWKRYLNTSDDVLADVERLRERLIRAYDWAENAVNGNDSAMMDYTEYVCGGEEE